MGQPIERHTRQDAFARYVLPEVELLLRVARSLTRHPADAEVLLQDTLSQAYRTVDHFDGSPPRAWLLTILRDTHAGRKRGHRPHTPQAAGHANEEPDSVVVQEEFDAAVEEALRALPAKFRIVVELVDLDGLSYQEAAVTLGIPVGTVLRRLHRGRGRIRAALEAAGIPQQKEDE